MATIKVSTNGINISPRKLRTFSNIVSKKMVTGLMPQLQILQTKGANILVKLLKNGVNIASSKNLSPDTLKIVEYRVDDGPRLKRWLPGTRGRGFKITKRMSHITITLSDDKK